MFLSQKHKWKQDSQWATLWLSQFMLLVGVQNFMSHRIPGLALYISLSGLIFFPHTKLLRLVLSQALDLSSKFSDLTSETSEICPSYRQLDCQPLCLECEAKAVLYVCAYNLTLPYMDIWPNLLAWGHHCFPSWSIFLRESHHLTFQTVPLFLPINHLIQLLLPSQTSQVSPSV